MTPKQRDRQHQALGLEPLTQELPITGKIPAWVLQWRSENPGYDVAMRVFENILELSGDLEKANRAYDAIIKSGKKTG